MYLRDKSKGTLHLPFDVKELNKTEFNVFWLNGQNIILFTLDLHFKSICMIHFLVSLENNQRMINKPQFILACSDDHYVVMESSTRFVEGPHRHVPTAVRFQRVVKGLYYYYIHLFIMEACRQKIRI